MYSADGDPVENLDRVTPHHGSTHESAIASLSSHDAEPDGRSDDEHDRAQDSDALHGHVGARALSREGSDARVDRDQHREECTSPHERDSSGSVEMTVTAEDRDEEQLNEEEQDGCSEEPSDEFRIHDTCFQ